MNKTEYVIMFPGQGSQHIGMGQDAYKNSEIVKYIYETAESIVNFPLKKYMFEGPEEKLKQTNITQPCLLTSNISLYETLMHKVSDEPSYICGHSAGEYAALYAAGVLSLEDSLKLIMHRGKLMHLATKGSMLAVLNATDEEVTMLCEKSLVTGGTLSPANWNSKHQTVISGDIHSIEKALDLAFEMDITVIPLSVSGAFHSNLMSSVVSQFSEYVEEVEFKSSKIPIIPNVTAQPMENSETWESLILKQLVSPVKWKQTIKYLYEKGIRTFVEVGPGNVLSKLVSKDYPDVSVLNVNDINTANNAALFLNEKKFQIS
ncbi:ACP S-malonyltransferase [Priestia aryabhattai]|uniref:ACP S-malonyltransferase n=1 Tax=Priestia megaterium TaxID=1404 RepID=UPI0039B8EA4B